MADMPIKDEWIKAMTDGEKALLTAMGNHQRYVVTLLHVLVLLVASLGGMVFWMARHLGVSPFPW